MTFAVQRIAAAGLAVAALLAGYGVVAVAVAYAIGCAIRLTMRDAASLGARRVSVGGAFARAAWGGFIRSAKELMEKGTFDELAHAAPYAELQKLFSP